jgi:hypothetical protein
LKPLKETLVTLIQSNEDVLTNALSLPVLASSLQVCPKFVVLNVAHVVDLD